MLNEKHIKEVMRLADVIENLAWSAGKTEQYHDEPTDYAEKLPAARAALEAYLRTIGEPAGYSLPAGSIGAKKFAQVGGGFTPVGLVFSRGESAMAITEHGRVYWDRDLVHPNGSKPADSEYTDEDMAAVGRALMSAIAQYAPKGWSPADCPSELVGDLHNECEELRSDADRYRKLRDEDAWGEDTAPDGVSAWALLGELHGSEFDAFVDSRAESSIETPAKVSPCAGHAVKLPDPLGLLSCTHPDCGRYEGPRSHECRAIADNACARPSICQGHAAQQDADALLARIDRAIWGLRREEEDRCDMELEDMPHDHSVWKEAKAAIKAMKGGS